MRYQLSSSMMAARVVLGLILTALILTVPYTVSKKTPRQEPQFLNGLYDAVPRSATEHLKEALGHGTLPYSQVRISSETLTNWDRKDIENIAHQNEEDLKKAVELNVRDCTRHPQAGKGPCWNSCLDPTLRVERDESTHINPDNTGPYRLERVAAVICPWHIRNERVSFSKDKVTIVRNRGRRHPKQKSKLTDDAGHLIASLLGGSTDIDSNAIPQAVVSNRGGEWRRSENYIANFLKQNGSQDGRRMVIYDIILSYDDTTGSASSATRPALIYYVANFYEWQPDKTFKLVEISAELLDNGPDDDEYELNGARTDL
ncbi:hypothetical protein RvY_02182 [Ramazzottius varieornatus]|uniref:Type VII secretion system protein EssD-like domain-containing protein n=1 Tax=Ramazzottius varieornatus TaxID=947166 RepID=A0A1D1UIU4_RAMVA|nr:hypothetical protein RvY_02182 [Ramazzottius varieornatus]